MSTSIAGIAENGQVVFGAGSTVSLEPVSAGRLALHREQEKRGEPMTLTRAEKSALDAQLEENCRIADNGGDLRWALAHADYHPWVLAVGMELIAQTDDVDPYDDLPSFSEMLEEAKAQTESGGCPLKIAD